MIDGKSNSQINYQMWFITVEKPYNIEMKTKQILKLIPENFDKETVLLGIKETLHN